MLHLAVEGVRARRAIPFPVLHVDTGHNFPEVIAYRDRAVERLRRAPASSRRCRTLIDSGGCASARTARATRCRPCRCSTRSTRNRFDAVFGGGRRDEEKARAKERVFSLRDEFGQWDPRRQRPELWDLYNGRHRAGEHVRVFPLSNWTELDVWEYVAREGIELPAIYYAHERDVFLRDGMWLAAGRLGRPEASTRPSSARTVRYRTVGDMSCTGAVDSTAATVAEVIAEVAVSTPHRARRHPRRRPAHRGRHGRPQARGVLLHDRHHRAHRVDRLATSTSCSASPPPAPSTTASPPSSAACCYDTKSVLADTLAAVERASVAQGPRRRRPRAAHRRPARRARAGHHDRRRLPLLLDRHAARSSSPTPPGHVQYTRNMVTGASTAELALVLVDARHGVVEQTRRHAVGCRAARRAPPRARRQQDGPRRLRRGGVRPRIRDEFAAVAAAPRRRRRRGDPAVGAAGRQRRRPAPTRTPWYDGPTLLEHLETVPVGAGPGRSSRSASPCSTSSARRPPSTPTTAATPAASRHGVVRVGDVVVVLPSGRTTTVAGDRRPRRPARRGVRAAVGVDPPRRRHRRRRAAT